MVMVELNRTILKLLNKRGIVSEEEIAEFISDKPQRTHEPSLLDDIQEGADLILSEIAAGSRICIYGDYDADGITSTALMTGILRNLMPKEKLGYYIPSRFEEGYGLNMEAVKTIADKGFDMIITVDCGSVSAEEVAYAQSLGMKILVTDHHNITDKMAGCLLINPKKPDGQYPFRDLSGCGVAFKLAQVIQQKAGLPKSVLTEVLDLVAIGTVGDIMPLVDENRTMVKFGLKIINTGQRPGLRRLIEGAGLKVGTVTSENIGFVIVPHLNASGRIEDASQAVKLLTAEEGDPCIDTIVEDLLFKNQERRRLQNETYKTCTADIDTSALDDFILIESKDAHEGIAGIVAGKIKDTYYRPAVILTPTGCEGKYLKGTGRSIEGVNLYELLKKNEALFEKFGGHAGACGFTMKAENLPELRENIAAEMDTEKAKNPNLFIKKYPVDMDLDFDDVTMTFADQLQLLAPFGNGNAKPLFRLVNVTIGDLRFMGTENQHVRFMASNMTGQSVQCVMFNKAGEYGMSLYARRPVELIGSLDCQVWQGSKRLQFIVDKIKFD
ncbi:MAG: single-stranded-DNA-specific exonuclease RecJ [Firmicutes bacterium]|nr:single-stranded-DNA-specific exonuclease RecJ [Bacillota bacterium]